jgi:hypothetical protein
MRLFQHGCFVATSSEAGRRRLNGELPWPHSVWHKVFNRGPSAIAGVDVAHRRWRRHVTDTIHTSHKSNGILGLPEFSHVGGLGFALRTAVAGIAAMFTAMWLQLDMPRWAIWMVFIVSPPVRRNALRKTASRS